MTTDESIDIVVLCGGMGTRLQSAVSDRQKCVAEVGSGTFLAWIIHERRSETV